MKLPTQIVVQPDGSGKSVQPRPGGARVERFTPESAADPTALSETLTRLQKSTRETAAIAAANPVASAIRVRNLTTGTSGAKLTVPHSFGRAAQWIVTGWRGAAVTTAPVLVEDTLDAAPLTSPSQLVLRSYVAGTLDLLLF